MTTRETIITELERHAEWHDDIAYIAVDTAADLIVDAEPTSPILGAFMAAYIGRPTEQQLVNGHV